MQMENSVSKPHMLSASLPLAATRPLFIKLTPILLAAALVGCASNAQHRGSGELTSKAQPARANPESLSATRPDYQPASYEEPAKPRESAPEPTAAPQVFKDATGGEGQEEGVAQPEQFGAEGAQAQQEHQATQFADQAEPTAEEKPFVQQPYVDDEVPPKDDGTAEKQQFTDETVPAKDEAKAAQQKFTDDASPPEDEAVTQQHFAHELAGAAKEEVPRPEVFKDEEPGIAPEEFVRPPETLTDDEKLAEAEAARVPPATMLPMTITVEADPLFDFDQYAIQPESRKKLDDLVKQLKGVDYGEVISIGFADPIGTHLYNQSLSQRRAAAVEQYLLSKGIPAEKVRIEARGDTEEYASYQSCNGHGKQNLIACLQPDRRVEVTVTATKQQ